MTTNIILLPLFVFSITLFHPLVHFQDTSGSIDTAPVHPATVMKISEMRDGGARYISRNSGRPSLSPSAGGRHFPDRLPPYTDICGFDDTRSDELSDRVEGHNLSLSTQQESEAYYACGDKRHSGSLDYRKERERNKDDRGHVVNVHSMDRTAARTGDLRVHQRWVHRNPVESMITVMLTSIAEGNSVVFMYCSLSL